MIISQTLLINWWRDRLGRMLLRLRFSPKERAGFISAATETVQIIHNNNHWITTACIGERVLVADSLQRPLCDYVVKQLRQLYAARINSDGVLRVNVVPCQTQPNGADCRVFAAAFAFEWACGNLDLGCSFDVAQMRGHMVKCLELDSIQSFARAVT